MKLSKKPSKEEKLATKLIRNAFKTDEELVSLIFTYMGMMSIMLDFLSETYGNPKRINELPERTKYAMAQAIHHYHLLGKIVRNEMKEEIETRFMPIEDGDWKEPNNITERMVLVVKMLYEQLKEEGKL